MDRGEPTFVPEWYKGSGSSAGSNHHSRASTHSEEHGVGLPSRNRLSASACDHDAPRSLASTDRSSSSFRRSASSNGSMSHDKDSSTHSRPYSSFGRNHRDRDREKDPDLHDKDRSLLLDNGLLDLFKSTRIEKDTARHSHSKVSGRQVESWPKRPGKDLSNGAHSGGSIISGISKAFFERDFPSLGAEEKHGLSDVSRVSSPGPSTAIQSLPIGASTVMGGDGWTSALAEVPVKVGGNGPVLSSALQTAPVSLASTSLSTTMGLNMAEALAQAPPRVRNAPQLSVDTQRIEELTRIQYTKLIPVTPSMSKSSVLNSSDKSKSKTAKGGDLSAPPKVVQHSPSQHVNQALRIPARSDIPKAAQSGNFQVLNRERNGISPTAKEGPSLMNATRVVTPLSGVPSAVAPPLKSPINPKLKADSKGGVLSTFGEKRPPSQAQNRNDFFNSLRKKTSANQSAATPEPSCVTSSSNSEKLSLQTDGTSPSGNQGKENSASSCGLENGNYVTIVRDACQEPEGFVPDNVDKSFFLEPGVPDEEEAAFLRSLGWVENDDGEGALTEAEIDDFVNKYPEVRQSLKQSHRELRGEAGSSPALSSTDSELEA